MAKLRIGYLVAPVVFALDQLVKWIVTGPLGVNEIGDQFYLLPFFQFTYTQNIGISLGLLNATTETGRWMLVALTTAIALGVAFWISREKNRTDQVALDGAGRRARQHPRPNAPWLCRRLRRPAFWCVPAVSDIQCRRCGD